VAALREPCEVVGPFVDLLHERRLGVHEAVVLEHAVDLGDDPPGVEHVLQDGLDEHAVDAPATQRDLVPARDELGQG